MRGYEAWREGKEELFLSAYRISVWDGVMKKSVKYSGDGGIL